MDVVEHQGAGNPHLGPYVGHTDDGKMAQVVEAMGVAAAYEEVQLTATVAATGWRQQAFVVDEVQVAVKQNDEGLEACLRFETIVEETLSSLGDSNALQAAAALVADVNALAETED